MMRWLRTLVFLIYAPAAASQIGDFRQTVRRIASGAQGTVAVACSLPGRRLDCGLNQDSRPPMQSVFKLPLAVATLHQVEQRRLALERAIRFQPDDRILPRTQSPLQSEHPEANVDVAVGDLLRLTVASSDNVAADILLRTIGGPKALNDYVASLGVTGFRLEHNEHDLHRDPSLQYRNWFTPDGAVALLRLLSDRSPLSAAHSSLLLGWMRASVRPRLAAALPAHTVVAHKAGTSGVEAGLAAATNDIGLITMPDGSRLAIAVFATDSRASEGERERVIAEIARAVYENALRAHAR